MSNINLLVSDILEESFSRGGAIAVHGGVGAASGALGSILGHAGGRYMIKKSITNLEEKIKTEKDNKKKEQMQRQLAFLKHRLEKTAGFKNYAKAGALGLGMGATIGSMMGTASTAGNPPGTRYKIKW